MRPMKQARGWIVASAVGVLAAGGCAGSRSGEDNNGSLGGGGSVDAALPDAEVPLPDAAVVDAQPDAMLAGFGDPCNDRSGCESKVCIFTGARDGSARLWCSPP